MQKRVIVLLLLAGLLVLVACAGGRPQIVMETSSLNLGDVVNGEVITRDVTVQNAGKSELVVEAVTSSCGCTQATLDPTTIAPGGSATLRIAFDSGAHGPDLIGPLLRQVFIASNDPQQPEAILELAANILPPDTPPS
jgi:hypothetical protein